RHDPSTSPVRAAGRLSVMVMVMGAPRGQGTPPPPQVSSECSRSSMLWFATLQSVQGAEVVVQAVVNRGTEAAYTATHRHDQTSFGTSLRSPPFTRLVRPLPFRPPPFDRLRFDRVD